MSSDIDQILKWLNVQSYIACVFVSICVRKRQKRQGLCVTHGFRNRWRLLTHTPQGDGFLVWTR